jgi:hypothetical protein
MAQQQQNVTFAAPGNSGINTQDSPLNLGTEWASVADNAVIDEAGRIASRGGYSVLNTSATLLNSDSIKSLFRFVNDGGTEIWFSCVDNKILKGTTTLVDITPVAYTINADNWQIVQLNNDVYFVQDGQEPLCYDGGTDTLTPISSHASYAGTAPQGSCALAAFGKLWIGGTTNDSQTLYWSRTLVGQDWNDVSSGSINLELVWPEGYDEIVALAAHNNFLIIFGKRSIIVYDGAESPASMSLSDSVSGIGCAARDSVQSIGTDLLFLDYNGVRSLGRTIQEKSAPIGDISANVHTDILGSLRLNNTNIKGVFGSDAGFYLLSFPTSGVTYVFDTRFGKLQDGSLRTTTWSSIEITAAYATEDALYFGNSDGVCKYTGYIDDASTYQFSYYSHPQTFGSAATLKFPKQLDFYVIGGANQSGILAWGFNYTGTYKTKAVTFTGGTGAEWGTAEFSVDEYVASAELTQPHVNTTGSGKSISVGFECTINGNSTALQEINLQTLLGRIV